MISRTRSRRPRLETGRRRSDAWRRRRQHARAPLPPRVWAAAVELVSAHGLSGTARALGVRYGALKRQVERDGRERPRPRARFVELPPGPVADGYLIEIARGAGLTLRVRLHGLPLSEVADFTRRGATPAS